MEKIDIRANFPVLNGGDGIILSKRGDICIGWELTLPPAFRCNEEKYDSLVTSLRGAITLLPDYTIIHKQDVFMRKRYEAEPEKGFLQEAYERHFDGREYLDHRCRLWLTFSSKKTSGALPAVCWGFLHRQECRRRTPSSGALRPQNSSGPCSQGTISFRSVASPKKTSSVPTGLASCRTT